MTPRPAGGQGDYIETVLTCKGNYYDPDFPRQLELFNRKLHLLLHAEQDELVIKKVEPWNSVKVTLDIPKNAAARLKSLASQDESVLRSMGIMAVQIEGDRIISLTLAGKDSQSVEITTPAFTGPSTSSASTSPQSSHQSNELLNNLFRNSLAKASSGKELLSPPNMIAPSHEQIPVKHRSRFPQGSSRSPAKRSTTKTSKQKKTSARPDKLSERQPGIVSSASSVENSATTVASTDRLTSPIQRVPEHTPLYTPCVHLTPTRVSVADTLTAKTDSAPHFLDASSRVSGNLSSTNYDARVPHMVNPSLPVSDNGSSALVASLLLHEHQLIDQLPPNLYSDNANHSRHSVIACTPKQQSSTDSIIPACSVDLSERADSVMSDRVSTTSEKSKASDDKQQLRLSLSEQPDSMECEATESHREEELMKLVQPPSSANETSDEPMDCSETPATITSVIVTAPVHESDVATTTNVPVYNNNTQLTNGPLNVSSEVTERNVTVEEPVSDCHTTDDNQAVVSPAQEQLTKSGAQTVEQSGSGDGITAAVDGRNIHNSSHGEVVQDKCVILTNYASQNEDELPSHSSELSNNNIELELETQSPPKDTVCDTQPEAVITLSTQNEIDFHKHNDGISTAIMNASPLLPKTSVSEEITSGNKEPFLGTPESVTSQTTPLVEPTSTIPDNSLKSVPERIMAPSIVCPEPEVSPVISMPSSALVSCEQGLSMSRVQPELCVTPSEDSCEQRVMSSSVADKTVTSPVSCVLPCSPVSLEPIMDSSVSLQKHSTSLDSKNDNSVDSTAAAVTVCEPFPDIDVSTGDRAELLDSLNQVTEKESLNETNRQNTETNPSSTDSASSLQRTTPVSLADNDMKHLNLAKDLVRKSLIDSDLQEPVLNDSSDGRELAFEDTDEMKCVDIGTQEHKLSVITSHIPVSTNTRTHDSLHMDTDVQVAQPSNIALQGSSEVQEQHMLNLVCHDPASLVITEHVSTQMDATELVPNPVLLSQDQPVLKPVDLVEKVSSSLNAVEQELSPSYTGQQEPLNIVSMEQDNSKPTSESEQMESNFSELTKDVVDSPEPVHLIENVDTLSLQLGDNVHQDVEDVCESIVNDTLCKATALDSVFLHEKNEQEPMEEKRKSEAVATEPTAEHSVSAIDPPTLTAEMHHEHEAGENGSSTSTDSGVVAGSPKSDFCATPPSDDHLHLKQDEIVHRHVQEAEQSTRKSSHTVTMERFQITSIQPTPVADAVKSRPCISILKKPAVSAGQAHTHVVSQSENSEAVRVIARTSRPNESSTTVPVISSQAHTKFVVVPSKSRITEKCSVDSSYIPAGIYMTPGKGQNGPTHGSIHLQQSREKYVIINNYHPAAQSVSGQTVKDSHSRPRILTHDTKGFIAKTVNPIHQQVGSSYVVNSSQASRARNITHTDNVTTVRIQGGTTQQPVTLNIHGLASSAKPNVETYKKNPVEANNKHQHTITQPSSAPSPPALPIPAKPVTAQQSLDSSAAASILKTEKLSTEVGAGQQKTMSVVADEECDLVKPVETTEQIGDIVTHEETSVSVDYTDVNGKVEDYEAKHLLPTPPVEPADVHPRESDKTTALTPKLADPVVVTAARRSGRGRIPKQPHPSDAPIKGPRKRVAKKPIEDENQPEELIGETELAQVAPSKAKTPRGRGKRGAMVTPTQTQGTVEVNGPTNAPSKRATRSQGVTDMQSLPTVYRDRRVRTKK